MATEDELWEAFDNCSHAPILRMRKMDRKNFAYVDFASPDHATRALEYYQKFDTRYPLFYLSRRNPINACDPGDGKKF